MTIVWRLVLAVVAALGAVASLWLTWFTGLSELGQQAWSLWAMVSLEPFWAKPSGWVLWSAVVVAGITCTLGAAWALAGVRQRSASNPRSGEDGRALGEFCAWAAIVAAVLTVLAATLGFGLHPGPGPVVWLVAMGTVAVALRRSASLAA